MAREPGHGSGAPGLAAASVHASWSSVRGIGCAAKVTWFIMGRSRGVRGAALAPDSEDALFIIRSEVEGLSAEGVRCWKNGWRLLSDAGSGESLVLRDGRRGRGRSNPESFGGVDDVNGSRHCGAHETCGPPAWNVTVGGCAVSSVGLSSEKARFPRTIMRGRMDPRNPYHNYKCVSRFSC